MLGWASASWRPQPPQAGNKAFDIIFCFGCPFGQTQSETQRQWSSKIECIAVRPLKMESRMENGEGMKTGRATGANVSDSALWSVSKCLVT